MNHYNINANLIRVIQNLYDKASSAVYLNGVIGDWFRTTVGVRQRCLFSPTLFNIFLERIMVDALEDHQGTVSIGGRRITNLRFADDIDGLAGSEQELENLVKKLDTHSTAFGMEISASKSKLLKSNGSKKQLSIPDLFSSKVLTGAEVTTAQVWIAPESRESSQTNNDDGIQTDITANGES